ncbi:hypothetical protein MEJ65_00785 [Candidatus Carsonella ruddii]|uniref:tryptophan--tRNA ligase n=1 Tax=Carsonella ruddii TaxID=114186 RepID=A0AAJ6FQM7_CARRU|nr:hypothetical protein [Candidatus Carsonella ruddii]WGS66605.1 hypothetical protein MEJ66_00790 [Candidatus Carsonella ruddii]WGS66803.1 hypothetical protein MEJ62_00775 [Candidatus Carsonella ruddii]WGS66994.1 hypothetical protein MEJ60_00775 [Candidatus Carsonella ruddii]WGS67186.1 hypothetical protein MEJ65_00785 [Candidatus Carsonella ruddii]WMC18202.1 MAG: hypothetical protein NU472_00790 [Candidatus Carsonella ruddii]
MILLGINSSGLIHFGNYLSLIKPVYKYNLKKIFLADLHCFSKNICFLNVLKNKILTIFTFLSFFKNNYFYQSFNLNILKIFWLILCFYNKNKTKFFHFFNRKKFFSLGKICYPLLMCSDIINNNNKFIFIGIDQIQHIEIYKKIKKKINFFLNTNLIKNCNFIINNKILYSYDKKKMSKSNKNDLFLFSNIIEIETFLKKFKNTKKKKKSILSFSLNIIENNYLINFFLKNNNNIFIKKMKNIIYYKFLPFKNNFFFYIKNINNIIKKINVFNNFSKNIINNNSKIIFKKLNL